MATKNIVNSHVDGDYLHGAELENIVRAAGGFGVLSHEIEVTVTQVDLDMVLPAFDYVCPDGSGGHVVVEYAGDTLTASANSSGNPRNDIGVGDSAGNVEIRDGTATEETGDVEDAPMVSLADDEILLFVVRRESGSTAVLLTDIRPRAIDVSQQWQGKGADIASAAALPLPDVGTYFDVTGTTTITSIESRPAGTEIVLQFDGILTLTHSTDLILAGGQSYTTAAGDVLRFVSEGSGDWREASRSRPAASGPAFLMPAFPNNSTSTQQMNSNTTARVMRAILPLGKYVSKWSMEVTTVGATGTMAFGLFSEDGQTRFLSGVTGTVSGTGLDTTDITDVYLPPGVYYVMAVSVGSTNLTMRVASAAGVTAAPASEREVSGTVTVTAGTIPATFDPDGDVTFNNLGAPIVRLD